MPRPLEIETIKQILSSHRIRMNVRACGCCNSPWIDFEYQGQIIALDLEDNELVMIEKDYSNAPAA